MATPTKRKAHKGNWQRKDGRWVRHVYNAQGKKTRTEEQTTRPTSYKAAAKKVKRNIGRRTAKHASRKVTAKRKR